MTLKKKLLFFLKNSCYEPTLIFDKKNQFPFLYRLALRILCVPVTSAPAERIFSKSGLIMTSYRSRLSTNTLSKLTFVGCDLDLLE